MYTADSSAWIESVVQCMAAAVYISDEEKLSEEVLIRIRQGGLAVAAPSDIRSSARRMWSLQVQWPCCIATPLGIIQLP